MTQMTTGDTTPDYDIAVIGAGLGGLAACILLRRAGLRVVCVEAEPFPRDRVGESFDWSTPALIASLGLQRDALVGEGIATYKRNIKIVSLGKTEFFGRPRPFFRGPPFRFEVTTLHADRVEFDRRLFEIARSQGTHFVWERVAAVDTDGDRVVACRTVEGKTVRAKWFIDASGQTRLFGKAFRIPKAEYGRRKICCWTYFDCPPTNDGTIFYADNLDDYLAWTWEIPITPHRLSVGCVMSAEQFQERRRGRTADAVVRDELARHDRFAPLLEDRPSLEVRTCSYRAYVSRYACGANWAMVGESASLPDPLTANGVTAAFRHASDASNSILTSLARGSFTDAQRSVYSTNIRRMGHAFNHSVERCGYEPWMRWGLSERTAERAYTAFSYTINALYAKVRPQGRRSMLAFGLLLRCVHLWIEGWSLAGRLAWQIHRSRLPQSRTARKRLVTP